MGWNAGQTSQDQYTTAIGYQAGNYGQQNSAVAIGNSAGLTNQQGNAVAIGSQAGQTLQQNSAIAIGYQAGFTGQAQNSIVINASGSPLNGPNSGLYVNPIRANTSVMTYGVYYATGTSEVTYAPVVSFSAVQTTTQIITTTTGVETQLINFTIDPTFQPNTGFASNYFTAPVTGIYSISVTVLGTYGSVSTDAGAATGAGAAAATGSDAGINSYIRLYIGGVPFRYSSYQPITASSNVQLTANFIVPITVGVAATAYFYTAGVTTTLIASRFEGFLIA